MRENNFPQVWVPGPENRDLRQLLWHRHRLAQMRTRIMNQLQALAMNEGYRWTKKLFSEQGRAQLEKLSLLAGTGVLTRNHPHVRADLLAAVEPLRSSDDQHVGECRKRAHARMGHQPQHFGSFPGFLLDGCG